MSNGLLDAMGLTARPNWKPCQTSSIAMVGLPTLRLAVQRPLTVNRPLLLPWASGAEWHGKKQVWTDQRKVGAL